MLKVLLMKVLLAERRAKEASGALLDLWLKQGLSWKAVGRRPWAQYDIASVDTQLTVTIA